MKVFRSPVLVRTLLGCFLALFAGCATAPKPGHQAVAPTLPAPAIANPDPSPVTATPPVEIPEATVAAVPEKPTTPEVAVTAVADPSTSVSTPTAIPIITTFATIRGSEELSILFDNFTAFIVKVDHQRIEGGRNGWDTPIKIESGRRILDVEFNRGVFVARATLEFEAKANSEYEVKHATDAELFGHNSYCKFWIVDRRTGENVTAVKKSVVQKITVAGNR